MDEREQRMRLAAFAHVERLSRAHGGLTYRQLTDGFPFGGQYIPLVWYGHGIGKVGALPHLLSLLTAWPQGVSIYSDQATAHEQVFASNGELTYDFMRGGADLATNQHLRVAWEREIPVIYFLAVAPAVYHAFLPVWIVDWNPQAGRYGQVRLAFGLPGADRPVAATERRAGLVVAQRDLHRARFREQVIDAYAQRCAISGEGGRGSAAERARSRQLLAVAELGSATTDPASPAAPSDGLLLTKLHRAALESHLIGIDADYQVHASQRLLAESRDPLAIALRNLDGATLRLPNNLNHHPNRDLLSARFSDFLHAP